MQFVYDVNRGTVVDPQTHISVGSQLLRFGVEAFKWTQIESAIQLQPLAVFGYRLAPEGGFFFRRKIVAPLYNKLRKGGVFSMQQIPAGSLDMGFTGYEKRVIDQISRYARYTKMLEQAYGKNILEIVRQKSVDELIGLAGANEAEKAMFESFIKHLQTAPQWKHKAMYQISRLGGGIVTLFSAYAQQQIHPVSIGQEVFFTMQDILSAKKEQLDRISYYRRLQNITGQVPLEGRQNQNLPFTRAEEYIINKQVRDSMVTINMLKPSNVFGQNPYVRFYS